jgi:hypothetical protein
VAVFHDYLLFEPGWKDGWDKFGDDWEVALNPIQDYDGSRMLDWAAWDYPGMGPGFLPYTTEITRYQYISGAYFAVKRDFYLDNQLDDHYRWGEGEDVEWSKRIRQKTTFKLNPHSLVKSAKLKGPMGGVWPANAERLAKIFLNNFEDNHHV